MLLQGGRKLTGNVLQARYAATHALPGVMHRSQISACRKAIRAIFPAAWISWKCAASVGPRRFNILQIARGTAGRCRDDKQDDCRIDAAMTDDPTASRKLAVLIDADNASLGIAWDCSRKSRKLARRACDRSTAISPARD